MCTFKKYMHIERLGTDEVEGIEEGTCYIFPKIDGTNASVWYDSSNGKIGCGSRNRELSLENDNHGFMDHIYNNIDEYIEFFKRYPHHHLFGEWLVPHSLKIYRPDVWRKFYVFDVVDCSEGTLKYVQYEKYKIMLEQFNIEYIPYLAKIKNPDYDSLYKIINDNNFLVQEGAGVGEGIVIKNYDFFNKYGRQTWAKIVTAEFKEKHRKSPKQGEGETIAMIEERIVDKFCTSAFIEKTYVKLVNDKGGWNSIMIPQFLNTVYHEFINEEMWNIVKEFKNPKVNFKTLQSFITYKIKKVKKELF